MNRDQREVIVTDGHVRLDRLPSLTGLRFVAAGGVFVGHALYISDVFSNQTIHQMMAPTLPLAMISVSFFFILSGFVLTWSARPADRPALFYRRRVLKIYPNHVVVWLVTLVFLAVTGTAPGPGTVPGVPAGPAVTSLVLVQSWIPSYRYVTSMNPVAWSLACEVFFYLLFPVLLPIIVRIRPNRLWLLAAGTVVVVWLIPLLALGVHGPPVIPGVMPLSITQLWITYLCPVFRLPEFILGIVLARMVHNGWRLRLNPAIPGLLTLMSIGLGLAFLPLVFVLAATTTIPLALLITAAATADLDGRRSALRRKTMVFLGTISYAFYISHYMLIIIVHYVLGNHAWGSIEATGVVLLFATLSVLTAWLLYRYIERPLMTRYAMPRSPTTCPPPQPPDG